ncbi:4-alpha-glucanotransferase [Paucimonas lemoignei]|uniref:4-alpha-glucanotransferase n=1 Tax=Paucimonas lemoignei TaxID=29443 RepID=A0A4V2UJA7_PAULE|nr:4-alpha-glucanotransferase [Paucimonas lemoignei]TCS39390.1 4-alpha-glucanotransferase [Paucimonas lemoignei]
MNEESILRLAQAAGLSRDWINAAGRPMQVAPEALARILEALGFPCASEEDCRDSLARIAALNDSTQLPPLVTSTIGRGVTLPLPGHLSGSAYRIILESGDAIDGHFPHHAGVIELPPLHSAGYHRLLAGDGETVLAIAPPRCFGVADALRATARSAGTDMHTARLWGLGVQLYSLRRAGDGGIGDFTSLARMAVSAASHGAGALAISPVHAMFSADVHRFSPYGPSSRLFLNALHIDPAAVLGKEAFDAIVAEMEPHEAEALHRVEQLDLIDWPTAAQLRLKLLRALYRHFIQQGPNIEFDAFRRQGGNALRDHARFEAIHAWRLAHGESGDWRTWPSGLHDPANAEVERFAAEHADEVRFHEFLQWQAARGLSAAQAAARAAGMPIGLIADLAVGADNAGSQAWSRQSELINGLSVGAPPDALNTRGQNWGLGAFSPHAMKAKGFGAYIEMLRATFAYAGGARIDHVLGLSRLWLVPQGASSADGAYLQYPLEDLLRLIALESWRHQAIVIGEDLGTVPPGFDRTLADAGLLGIRVLLFERDAERFRRPEEWSADAIATTATHDLPTIAGWWQGRDIDWRKQLDLLEEGQSEDEARAARANERAALAQALFEHAPQQSAANMSNADQADAAVDAAAAFIAATPAPLALLPIEDALGLVEQPNLPGTVDTHPNWRRRLPQPVDSLLDAPGVARRLAALNRSRSYR